LALILYILFNVFELQYAKLITSLAFIGSLIYHFIMESMIDMDDYDEKIELKDFMQDFKYCAIVGLIPFLTISLLGIGFSLLNSGSIIVGVIFMIIGVCIWGYTHAEKHA